MASCVSHPVPPPSPGADQRRTCDPATTSDLTLWRVSYASKRHLVPESLYHCSALRACRLASRQIRRTLGLSWADGCQFKAFAAFVGTTLAASIRLIGLLLTDAHNEKVRKQSALDTAVKVIALISDPGHNYAPKAAVGGALAALVDLDQRVIAMRTLDAAWDDNAVHASTASWLVGEVIKTNADVQGVLEATEVLRNNADRLVGTADKRGRHFWPQSLLHEWPNKVPVAARMDLLVAIARLASPAAQVIRSAGSTGRCSGRSRRTLSLNHRIEPVQPTRSASTVAGMSGVCPTAAARAARTP